MRKAVIVSAVRSAVGKYAGQWSSIEPYKFGALFIREAVKRAGIDPNEIEDVVMGNLYGQHGNIARVTALEAGIPMTCGAVSVDRQCGSSIQTINDASLNIIAGNGDVYVACGMEHMTLEPWQYEKTITPYQRLGPNFMNTRLTPDNYGNDRMGATAEKVAAMYGLTRQELDEYAYNSHKKAAKAIKEGYFDEQILPVEVSVKGKSTMINRDEVVRSNITLEDLAKLKPAFREDGVVTAGNSCPWSDGASALVIMSDERAAALGLKSLGTIRSFAVAGLDPSIMGLGPIHAVPKALKRAGITVGDLGCVELNEAFAAQVIPCMRELGIPEEKVNPNGGGISLGHPLGATGAVLTTKLVYEMQRRNLRYGLVTMCIGGGQGAALVIENEA